MSKQYPSTVQLIPNELSVQIHRHDLPYFQPVPCWTFITDGLWAHKQKEVVITLRRDDQVASDEHPQLPLHIIRNIYNLAVQGQLVDVWGYSYFMLAQPQEKKSAIFYTAYLYPLPLPGIKLPSPALTVIFMSEADYKLFQAFGLTRLIAIRGNHFHYYPCPPWSEFPLPDIVSLGAMQRSILNKMLRIHLQGSTVTMEGTDVVLRLQPRARRILGEQLSKIKPQQPIALLPELDPNANACLFWDAEKNATGVNVPPQSNLSRTAGCFVAFVPEQAENSSRIFEDGFAVLMTTEHWLQTREAMVSGEPVKILTKGKLKQFRLEHV